MSCSVIRTTFGVLTKIERTLFAMEKAEEQTGKETPVLVHTDLTVVDEDLRVLASSYRHTVNGNWQRTALHWELAQNTVTGCTAMYNRALGDLLQDEPSFFVMHDWWLALTGKCLRPDCSAGRGNNLVPAAWRQCCWRKVCPFPALSVAPAF